MPGQSRYGRADALALIALVGTALVTAAPILRGAYATYIDNAVHLAEILELSRPDGPAWSELGFGGFPLGTLHSPLWYPLLAFLVRHGAPGEGVYCAALILGFLAPSLSLYFVARRRVPPIPSALLAYLLLVQPATIWGIGSPLGGMWTHALSSAGFLILADFYSRPHLTRTQHWIVAVVLALSVLTHLFVIPLVAILFASSVLVLGLQKRITVDEVGKRVAGGFVAAAASAQYWLVLVLVGNEGKAPHQAFAPREFFARLFLPADAMFLIDGHAEESLRMNLFLTDAAPILVLFLLGVLGLFFRKRLRDDALPATGFCFGIVLLALLFTHYYVRIPVFGPVSFRLIEGVRLGMALSATAALAAVPRREPSTASRAFGVGAAVMAIASGFWWRVPLERETGTRSRESVEEVHELGQWLATNHSPDWGRVYLQDTFGFEWRTAGITLTHVPVLAFRDSRVPQLGTYYGVVPFQLRWSGSEFNTLYGMWDPTEEWVHEAMDKTNAGVLVTSNAWMAEHVGAFESFRALARIGRYTVFRRTGAENRPVAELTPFNRASEVHEGPDAIDFTLTTEYPRTRVLVKTSWHPFWRLSGIPGASLRESPEGFLVLDAIPKGTFAVKLRFVPSHLPLWVTVLGWLVFVGWGVALYRGFGRSSDELPAEAAR
jgi:hypothetical protein